MRTSTSMSFSTHISSSLSSSTTLRFPSFRLSFFLSCFSLSLSFLFSFLRRSRSSSSSSPRSLRRLCFLSSSSVSEWSFRDRSLSLRCLSSCLEDLRRGERDRSRSFRCALDSLPISGMVDEELVRIYRRAFRNRRCRSPGQETKRALHLVKSCELRVACQTNIEVRPSV